jgi:DNA-binding NarL/FixJ family response regulator
MGSLLFGPLFHGLSAAIAFHRGDLDAADRAASAGESQVAVTGPQIGFEWCVYARSQLLSARGEIAPAHAIVSGAWHLARAAGFPMAFRYFGPIAVSLALASEDSEAASAVVADVEAFAARSPSPTAKGTAARCRGLVEDDPEILVSAVEVLRMGRRPLELAGACEDAGRVLLRKGDSAQAASLLEEAAGVFDRITARGDAERAAQMLNGKASARTRRRSGQASGWDSLSPTERRVSAFVAEGLSNVQVAERLVVSRRTVETHVYHLFQKLGVSSRVELALKVSKEGEQPRVQ